MAKKKRSGRKENGESSKEIQIARLLKDESHMLSNPCYSINAKIVKGKNYVRKENGGFSS
jgi:hypothetical protein